MSRPADVALVGLAVMGQNLALNLADHGYRMIVYNRTTEVADRFVASLSPGTPIRRAETLRDLVSGLARPRTIILMVKAGGAVDAVLDALIPLLEPGDIVIDGGNSLYTDTIQRTSRLEAEGLRFVGAGISGGEEGARHGPSIMPGGSRTAWDHIGPILQAVAARADDGTPCCDWVGPDGAGHYVKMVHNGIEYGDMQIIAEAYWLLRAMGLAAPDMAEVFRSWNRGRLSSYLVDITADILGARDDDGQPMVDRILDAAGQKGTGKWTVISSMEIGQPVSLVAEAVYARIVSALKEQRTAAAGLLAGPAGTLIDVETYSDAAPESGDAIEWEHDHRQRRIDALESALYASKIVSYAQGFMLLAAASEEHDWNLDLGRIASLWREGCIIRAAFLDDITRAFGENPGLASLLVDPTFRTRLAGAQSGWRATVAAAVSAGIPVPAYSSALAFYDAYRSEQLPANLIQAQRDYFGAHTYERTDRPRGEFFHTDWTGHGGAATAGTYQA